MTRPGIAPTYAQQMGIEADKHAADLMMLEYAARGLVADLRGGGGGIFSALLLDNPDYARLASETADPIKFGEPWQGKGIGPDAFKDHYLTRPGNTRVEALTRAEQALLVYAGQTVVEA